MNNELGNRPQTLETNRSIYSEQPITNKKPEVRDDSVMVNNFGQNISKERFQENAAHNAQKYSLRPGSFNSVSFHTFHSNIKK